MSDKTMQTVADELRLAARTIAMAGLDVWGDLCKEAADTIDTLRAQLAEAQKNEKRYLWMRDKETSEGWDIIGRSGTPDQIDAAIDAAMGEPS